MREIDLNDLSKEAVDSVITVLQTLTGKDEDTHIYQGETYLFSIHKASEREFAPGLIRGTAQPGQKPSDVIAKIRANLMSQEEYQAECRSAQIARQEAAGDPAAGDPAAGDPADIRRGSPNAVLPTESL